MADHDRMIRLFGYEWENGRYSIFWQEPKYFLQPVGQSGENIEWAFTAWKAQKRAFTREEVLQGQWIKVGDHGYHRIVRFHADGTLTETDLFNPEDSWRGQWQLVNYASPVQRGPIAIYPILRSLSVFLRMNVREYELDIFACKESAIHSGIEFQSGGYQPTAYFKVIHLA
jgi:hypothetical protein